MRKGVQQRRATPVIQGGTRILMRQHSIRLRDVLLALEGAHDHVDVRDDAPEPRVGLLRRQAQLQDQAVHLVDHQAQPDLQRSSQVSSDRDSPYGLGLASV